MTCNSSWHHNHKPYLCHHHHISPIKLHIVTTNTNTTDTSNSTVHKQQHDYQLCLLVALISVTNYAIRKNLFHLNSTLHYTSHHTAPQHKPTKDSILFHTAGLQTSDSSRQRDKNCDMISSETTSNTSRHHNIRHGKNLKQPLFYDLLHRTT